MIVMKMVMVMEIPEFVKSKSIKPVFCVIFSLMAVGIVGEVGIDCKVLGGCDTEEISGEATATIAPSSPIAAMPSELGSLTTPLCSLQQHIHHFLASPHHPHPHSYPHLHPHHYPHPHFHLHLHLQHFHYPHPNLHPHFTIPIRHPPQLRPQCYWVLGSNSSPVYAVCCNNLDALHHNMSFAGFVSSSMTPSYYPLQMAKVLC